MTDHDPDRPVTHAELVTSLHVFKTELMSELRTDFKTELKSELTSELTQSLTQSLTHPLTHSLTESLGLEIARHMNAGFERMHALFGVIDEKYQDLPGRVNRLEVAVFDPPAPARR